MGIKRTPYIDDRTTVVASRLSRKSSLLSLSSPSRPSTTVCGRERAVSFLATSSSPPSPRLAPRTPSPSRARRQRGKGVYHLPSTKARQGMLEPLEKGPLPLSVSSAAARTRRRPAEPTSSTQSLLLSFPRGGMRSMDAEKSGERRRSRPPVSPRA